MDIIKDLVQTLIIIVVLAVFLDMLLPRGDMTPYVKMVMGLLIIISVLHAISGLLKQDWFHNLPDVKAGAGGGPPVEDIIAAGNEMKEKNRDLAVDKYREGIASQVKSLAGLNPGVDIVEAVVELQAGSQQQKNIEKIVLVAAPPAGNESSSDRSTEMVPPVEINTGQPVQEEGVPAEKMSENVIKAAQEVKQTIANFYNLPRDKVIIKYQN